MTGHPLSERANPRYPASKLALYFNGSLLTMVGGSQTYTYPASSGRTGVYEAIPKGKYWIEPDELWHCDNLRQAVFWLERSSCNESGWGMYRITIHPFPNTNTGGRGGFFIHGGSHTGSAGCINLNLRIDDFFRDMKRELKDGQACYIPLTVL